MEDQFKTVTVVCMFSDTHISEVFVMLRCRFLAVLEEISLTEIFLYLTHMPSCLDFKKFCEGRTPMWISQMLKPG